MATAPAVRCRCIVHSTRGPALEDTTEQNPLDTWVLREVRRGQVSLPAFPTMATRLIDALEQPNVETEEVRDIISQDPAIMAQVIRASNAAIYGAACPVEDLQHAIMRIGFRETAAVAMLAASRALFTLEDRAEVACYPTLWPALWQNALVSAFGTKLLARQCKLGDPTRVFMAALFHDIGSLLILKLISAGLVRGRLRDKPEMEELAACFSRLHPTLGAGYLETNHMPAHVIDVALRHHHVDLPFAHDTVSIHLVRLADGLCDRIGAAPFAQNEMGPPARESAAVLGIDENEIETYVLQFEALREQLSGLVEGPPA